MRLALVVALGALSLANPALAQERAVDSVADGEAAERRERDPDYLRAAVEESFFLAVGAAWYWIDRDKNAVDWDFDSWTQRFDRSAFRFDNNRFQVNWIFHPFAGSSYYGFARANELHAGWAFAYTFLTSFLWEWLLEFKERVSINDQIATPVGGMALGEFWTKLSWWLHHRGTTPARSAAAWTLGLGVRAHQAIDGEGPEAAALAGMHARFRLNLGASVVLDGHAPDVVGTVGFEGRIVDLRGWHRDGTFSRRFGDANFASLRGSAGLGESGGSFALEADTLVAGFHAQALRGDLATAPGVLPGAVYGASATVAAAIGYSYRRTDYGGYGERLGVIHLPGFGFESVLAHGLTRLRFSLRGHGDFASADVDGAYQRWADAHPDARTKTILERESYFYGWGASARIGLELEVGRFHTGVRAAVGQWWSHEGLDRTQEAVTDDVEAVARRVAIDHWARVELPRGLHVEARYQELRRRDRVGAEQVGERRLRRVGIAVGITR